ncbi:hypothetical protein L1887_23579 [Cichorium endivia]|nr:hypothetical protein L1887_23579 [Cichorium endivia]
MVNDNQLDKRKREQSKLVGMNLAQTFTIQIYRKHQQFKKGYKMPLVKRFLWPIGPNSVYVVILGIWAYWANILDGPPTKQLRSKIMVAFFNKPPGPLLASSVKDEQVMFRLLMLESSCG